MHEVKPVTSGHRLVLTYNLIHDTLGPRELAATSDITIAKLKSIFSCWNDKIGGDPLLQAPLAFILEHQYTEIALSEDALKGRDQHVASHLRPACEESGFLLYLASFTRMIRGSVEMDYGDPEDWMREVIMVQANSTTLKTNTSVRSRLAKLSTWRANILPKNWTLKRTASFKMSCSRMRSPTMNGTRDLQGTRE
jgi:hypothetical protein